jgi:phospholipase C
VKEPNITDWRRQTFGDLMSTFRFDEQKANPPQLPDTVNALSRARYEAAYLPKPVLPAAEQKLPPKSRGQRKRVPPKQA